MKRSTMSPGIVFLCLCLSFLAGCGVKEGTKRVLGTSTALLEERRPDSISKEFHCSYQDCFNVIMDMGRRKQSLKPWVKQPDEPDTGVFDVFNSDLYANPPYIVVMGIDGNIDTTEAGIFFTRTGKDTIRVDVTSLATSAKRKVAGLVFARLEQYFKPAL